MTPFRHCAASARPAARVAGLVLAVGLPGLAAGAGPVFWDYPVTVPFERCELVGAGLDAYGRLAPGLRAEVVPLEGPEVVWCLIPDGEGGAWGGSGHDGELWRFPRDGAPRRLARLPEPELFSLARAGGVLFAGGAPDGLIFRVASDGTSEAWADLPEQYVWALTVAPDGKLYAAVGSPAAVYRIDGRLDVTKLADLPAANAMDLAFTSAGRLLVATQGPGLVWEIDPAHPAAARVLWEAPQDEVRQLVAGPDGLWYALALPLGGGAAAAEGAFTPLPAGTTSAEPDTGAGNVETAVAAGAPRARHANRVHAGTVADLGGLPAPGPDRAAIYRIGRDGVVVATWAGSVPIVAIAWTERWGWVGVGARDQARAQFALFALGAPGSLRPLATWEGGDPIDLLAIAAGDGASRLCVAQARPGQIVRLSDRPAEAAVAVAPPIDGKVPIRWGRLRWEGDARGGATVRLAVRGGPRAVPDPTWSAWSEAWSDDDHAIPLAPSRFLQWRAEFAGSNAEANIGAVTVSGYEPNVAPRILRFDLQPPGELTAGGSLDDGGGVTESFPSGLRAEYNVESRRDRHADPLAAARVRPLRLFTWQGWDANGDHLLYTLAYRRVGEEAWRPLGEETPETVKSWDSAEVPDGTYVVRLTASDHADNPPREALTAERLSLPLLVDNTPPTVSGFQVTRTADGLKVSARVADGASPLTEAWLELPDGRTVRFDPTDGICDSLTEDFAADFVFPEPDTVTPAAPWRVRAGFVDRAGNVGRAEGETR
ncbi:MAG: hypothetical protein ACYDIE_13840 [Candidatus Krumholzibacteriia bacterium]